MSEHRNVSSEYIAANKIRDGEDERMKDDSEVANDVDAGTSREHAKPRSEAMTRRDCRNLLQLTVASSSLFRAHSVLSSIEKNLISLATWLLSIVLTTTTPKIQQDA
jgi:hypothetical protein